MITLIAVIAALLAALLIYAATRPGAFEVRRAASIDAPPEKIFALIDDLQRWAVWSPWEKMDPQMKKTFAGPAAGKGSTYAWEGNAKVGAGRMEISASTAPSNVVIQLDFMRPFEGHNVAEFTLAPQGGSTNVTWTMRGKSAFMIKLMGLFVSMDKMIGKDFEAGLANLKAAVET
jgi:carbon monoxide dehydrogenase subunit G